MNIYRARYQIDKLKALYTEYNLKPTPSKVHLLSEQTETTESFKPQLVKINWQYRDANQLKTIGFQKSYTFNADRSKLIDVGLPQELSNELTLEAFSQNGQRHAVLKSKTDLKNGKLEQFIVLYDRHQAIKTIDVKALNDRMTIVENATFSSFVLNDVGTMLLCTVVVNDKALESKDESPASKDYDLNLHEYRQSWGEKLNTIYHSSIAVIDLELGKLIIIEKEGLSLMSPFFFKSCDAQRRSIGCIGLQELPYKLGLIYCSNRTSFLLASKIGSDLADHVSPVEPEIYYGEKGNLALSEPRVYYDATKADYDCRCLLLERDTGGALGKSARLLQFCFESRKAKTILDNRQRRPLLPDSTTYSDIGPLFCLTLPQNCFTNDGKFAILHSDTPLSTIPFIVDLQQPAPTALRSLSFPLDNCKILNVKNDWIVAIGSSLNRLPNVYLCDATHRAADFSDLKWLPVEEEKNKLLSNIAFDTFSFSARDHPDKLVNCIWTSPQESIDTAGPTIIMPHGGPHGVLTKCYYQSIALYTELGLKTCLINYVGSTGVDDDYTNALLGNVGTSDIHDVYDSIQYVIKHKHADKDRIILYGGSHGGFLVTSISGQHPELNFLACFTRNPVIDISGMCTATDIPDWCMVEALGPVGNSTPVSYAHLYAETGGDVETMHRKSPIAHVQNVKVPTLMMLGKEDLRVPYSQGLLYHRLLKARGIETRCFIYDDVHGLQKINVDFDFFLQIVQFMEKFIFYREI